MPIYVFLIMCLIAAWAVFAIGYDAGQRWPIIGRIIEEYYGSFLIVVVVVALLAILLGALGIEIKSPF